MFSVLRDSWALMLGTAMIMTAHGLSTTLIGVRGAQLAFGDLRLGLVMSGYFIGFAAGSILAPFLIRRVGHVRVFAAFASAASATLILFPVHEHAAFWFVLRMLNGTCMAGSYVVAEAWLNGISTDRNRGQALGLYVLVQLAGFILGQVLLGVGDPTGYELFVVATVVTSLAIGPVLLSAAPVPVHTTIRPMSFRELLSASPLAFFGMIFMGLLFSIMSAMTAVYGVSTGLTVAQIAALVSATYIGGTLFLYPAGWLSDQAGRRPVVIVLSFSGAAAAVLAGMSGSGGWLLITLVGVMGAAISPLYSLLGAHANDRMDPDRMAACSARLVFLQGAGAAAGPPLAGAAMTAAGPSAFFPLIALLAASLGILAAWRVVLRQPEAPDDTVGFAPLPVRSTAIAAEMYADVVQEDGTGGSEA